MQVRLVKSGWNTEALSRIHFGGIIFVHILVLFRLLSFWDCFLLKSKNKIVKFWGTVSQILYVNISNKPRQKRVAKINWSRTIFREKLPPEMLQYFQKFSFHTFSSASCLSQRSAERLASTYFFGVCCHFYCLGIPHKLLEFFIGTKPTFHVILLMSLMWLFVAIKWKHVVDLKLDVNDDVLCPILEQSSVGTQKKYGNFRWNCNQEHRDKSQVLT